MAYYAALVSLVQLLEDIINHRDRFPNLRLHKQQIASVHEKFSLLHTLLDDYSPKDRAAADILERRIRDAAYQAKDIIEFHISNQICQKGRNTQIFVLPKAMLRLLQPQRYVKLRLDDVTKEYHDLENVKEEVDSIVEELMTAKKNLATDDLQLNYYSADAKTSNQASDRNTMVGFEEPLTTIKDKLCGEPSKRRVVSIVGIGGIGKSTLARNIFDDKLILYRFDYRAWVTISQDYHRQKVLLDILDSMKITTNKSSGVGELEEKIYKHLKGRRYLIVMDDMWDTKVWDDVKRIFPDDSNGSRVMITTRILDVAFYADKFGFYHQMQFLSEKQSWNLFREKVSCPPKLERTGWLIAKNCRGLPLAIVVVAGILNKVDKNRFAWEEIARNVSSAVAENDEHFSKILSLSYNHLPHHLKPCLLYIASFPKYYEIRVSKLVKLWIAEGLLKPIEPKSLEAEELLKPIEPKSLEEVAEEYLEDLANRNLVLTTKKRFNGKIKYCSIHDLLRDLCMERVRYESFLHVLDEDHLCILSARNVHRLFIAPIRPRFVNMEEFSSHIRSIIVHPLCHLSCFPCFSSFLSGLKLLRVLDAIEQRGGSSPAKIFKHFHLRYLAVTESLIPNIPPSISQLQNLQTLIIKPNSFAGIKVCSLPTHIQEMPNLRHIISSNNLLFKCHFFDKRTSGLPSILENLQTLSWVCDVRFTNKVIKVIPNLQKLKVWYAPEPEMWQKFRIDNLFHLRQLETLNITTVGESWLEAPYPLPESFAFPLTLKKLSLIGCGIPWEDMTVVGSLPKLQVLKLRGHAFVGDKWEPVEGEFPQLKFLLMENLVLKYWQAEKTHFPTLQQLKISFCNRLQEIPPEIGEISTLQLVEVNFSELAAKTALKMQEEQWDMGNDVLQVRVYPQWADISSGSEDEIQEEDDN